MSVEMADDVLTTSNYHQTKKNAVRKEGTCSSVTVTNTVNTADGDM